MEFDLSSKRKQIIDRFGNLNGDHVAMLMEVLRIVEEQDKEFIRLLKEELCEEKLGKHHATTTCENDIEQPTCTHCNKIDKLAGEDLI